MFQFQMVNLDVCLALRRRQRRHGTDVGLNFNSHKY